MSQKFGRCPKCRRMRPLTDHHIVPRRIRDNDETIRICRPCHDELEKFIVVLEKQLLRKHESLYVRALSLFLEAS